MFSEQWLDFFRNVLFTLIGGGVTFFFTRVLKTKPEVKAEEQTQASAREKLLSELVSGMIEANKGTAEINKMGSEQLKETYQQLFSKMDEVDTLKQQLSTERAERNKQHEELSKKIAVDTEQTNKLLSKMETMEKQIKEGDEKYESLNKKYNSLKTYTLSVLDAVKNGKEPPEPPKDLMDSISGWKWNR